jgi:hypothetical protein
MRKEFLAFFLIFLLSGCGIVTKYRIIENREKVENIEIESPQKRFQIGERFIYKAEWLGMDVGIARITVKEITQMNGREVYHIHATAETTPLVSKIYKVEDEISSYLDVEELYPVRFEMKQREGGHRSDGYIDFDQEEGIAFYFSRLNNSKKEYSIPKKVQDPLSCMYYFRFQDADVGRSIFAEVNADEKNYLLEAKIWKKGIIKIKDVGEWDSFMVEPLPWFQGKVTRKAKATMWFSADEKRIPLLMVTSGIPFVGTVTITLQKIEYLDTRNQ